MFCLYEAQLEKRKETSIKESELEKINRSIRAVISWNYGFKTIQ